MSLEDNEFKFLSDCISNNPLPNLKKWKVTIDAISDKLENGSSKEAAVMPYLNDKH